MIANPPWRLLSALSTLVLLVASCAWDSQGPSLPASGADGLPAVADPDVGSGVNQPPAPGNGALPVPPSVCGAETRATGPSPLRRLTHFEYRNSVRDLLHVEPDTLNFPPEARTLGFDNNAQFLSTSPALLEAYLRSAEQLSSAAVAKLGELAAPCDPGVTGADACATAFINEFVARAYRRPVVDEDRTPLLRAFNQGLAAGDYRNGIREVIGATLLSAPFLYRPVFGVGEGAQKQLTSYELASNLSYLLTGSIPDAELMQIAAGDQLLDPALLEQQTQRLMQTPAAAAVFEHFNAQWLGLPGESALIKASFEGFNGELVKAARAASLYLAQQFTFADAGNFASLVMAPVIAVNQQLAEYYGIPGDFGEEFTLASDQTHRAGVLTDPALLAAHSGQGLDSVLTPIMRGKWVQEQFFCNTVPPPPADVPTPPNVSSDQSMRDRLEHRVDPACSTCHALLDPIGLAFENFDAVGRYRETDRDLPIDPSGVLAVTDVDGEFSGAAGLGQKIASSQQAQMCLARRWFRYAVGRGELATDQCSLDYMMNQFAGSGFKVSALVKAATQVDAFRFRDAAVAPVQE